MNLANEFKLIRSNLAAGISNDSGLTEGTLTARGESRVLKGHDFSRAANA